MPARKRASSTERRSSASKKKSRTSAEMCSRELPASARNAMSYNEMRSALKAAGYNCGPTATSLAWAKRKEELGIVTVKGRRSAGRRTPEARAAGVVAAARATVAAAAGRARKSTERRAVSERAPARAASTRGVVIMMKPQETAAAAIGFKLAGFDWAQCLSDEKYGKQCFDAITKRFPTLLSGCVACPRPSPAPTAAATVAAPAPAMPVVSPSPAATAAVEKVEQQTGVSAPMLSVVSQGQVVAIVTGEGNVKKVSPPVPAPSTPATPSVVADPTMSKEKIEALENVTPPERQALQQITAAVNVSTRVSAAPVKTAAPGAAATAGPVSADVAKQQAQQSQRQAEKAAADLAAAKRDTARATEVARQASHKAAQSGRAVASGAAAPAVAAVDAAEARQAEAKKVEAQANEAAAKAKADVAAAAATINATRAQAAAQREQQRKEAPPIETTVVSYTCPPLSDKTANSLAQLLAYKSQNLGPNQRLWLERAQYAIRFLFEEMKKTGVVADCEKLHKRLTEYADQFEQWKDIAETPCVAETDEQKATKQLIQDILNFDVSAYPALAQTAFNGFKQRVSREFLHPDLLSRSYCNEFYWGRDMKRLIEDFEELKTKTAQTFGIRTAAVGTSVAAPTPTSTPLISTRTSAQQKAAEIEDAKRILFAPSSGKAGPLPTLQMKQMVVKDDLEKLNAYCKQLYSANLSTFPSAQMSVIGKFVAEIVKNYKIPNAQLMQGAEKTAIANNCKILRNQLETIDADVTKTLRSMAERAATRATATASAKKKAPVLPVMIKQGEYPNERFVPADKTRKYEYDKGYQFVWGADRKADWFYVDEIDANGVPIFQLCTHPSNEKGCIRLASLPQMLYSYLGYGYYTYDRVPLKNEKGAYVARPFNYEGQRTWFYANESTKQGTDKGDIYTYNWQLCNGQDEGEAGCTLANTPTMLGGEYYPGEFYFTYDSTDKFGNPFQQGKVYDFVYKNEAEPKKFLLQNLTEGTDEEKGDFISGWKAV